MWYILNENYILLFLIITVSLSNAQDVPSETCLRCICHSRSGCFFMRNCANYSISREYWLKAGSPTILDDDENATDAYSNCMKNDGCIMRAMKGYISSISVQDCDCDGQTTCKDYAAIHLKGENCRSDFDSRRLQRFDKCATDRNVANTPGWDISQCLIPSPQ